MSNNISNSLATSLAKRLQSIANHKSNGSNSGLCRIDITYFVGVKHRLLGWYMPLKIPIEPKTFSSHHLNYKSFSTWEDIVKYLIGISAGCNTQSILVENGKPIGVLQPEMVDA